APGDLAFLAVLPVDLGTFFILFDLVKFRLQHFQSQLAVTALAALGLTGDDNTGRFVHDAHRGFYFVYVLTAFAAATASVDLHVGTIGWRPRRSEGSRMRSHDRSRPRGTGAARILRACAANDHARQSVRARLARVARRPVPRSRVDGALRNRSARARAREMD